MIKLFITPNSPYARIARVAVREFGLVDRVEEIPARNRQPDNPVLQYSPVGRVPTLVADALVITEAKHVHDYLRECAGLPMELGDWNAVAQDGLISGFLEGVAAWVRENRRHPSERSTQAIQVERDRALRCLLALEASTACLPAIPVFRAIGLAVALDLMHHHDLLPVWREDCPTLAGWSDEQAGQRSMRETRLQS